MYFSASVPARCSRVANVKLIHRASDEGVWDGRVGKAGRMMHARECHPHGAKAYRGCRRGGRRVRAIVSSCCNVDSQGGPGGGAVGPGVPCNGKPMHWNGCINCVPISEHASRRLHTYLYTCDSCLLLYSERSDGETGDAIYIVRDRMLGK